MLLNDLLDVPLLIQMRREGYVAVQTHPELPLAILNYTHRCQYDRAWNDVTRQCRGLIYNTDTREIVARPWPKFHNYGEHEEGSLNLGAYVAVTDKLDGSLGILYPTSDGECAIATRGSFTSEQALHATEVWRDRYEGEGFPGPLPTEFTYLFEIIYPGNRIVVDYGDLDDIVLLGVVATETGLPASPRFWPGPRAAAFEYRTLADALAAEPRPNCEGLVVHFIGTSEMIKLKQEDYVALHRIVTGLNERTVWEHLQGDGQISTLLEPLPEEFHAWVREVAERLLCEEGRIILAAHGEYDRIVTALGGSIEAIATVRRREFAQLANASEFRPYLFMILDGKNPAPAIWKTLRPSHPRTLVDVSEAVA